MLMPDAHDIWWSRQDPVYLSEMSAFKQRVASMQLLMQAAAMPHEPKPRNDCKKEWLRNDRDEKRKGQINYWNILEFNDATFDMRLGLVLFCRWLSHGMPWFLERQLFDLVVRGHLEALSRGTSGCWKLPTRPWHAGSVQNAALVFGSVCQNDPNLQSCEDAWKMIESHGTSAYPVGLLQL